MPVNIDKHWWSSNFARHDLNMIREGDKKCGARNSRYYCQPLVDASRHVSKGGTRTAGYKHTRGETPCKSCSSLEALHTTTNSPGTKSWMLALLQWVICMQVIKNFSDSLMVLPKHCMRKSPGMPRHAKPLSLNAVVLYWQVVILRLESTFLEACLLWYCFRSVCSCSCSLTMSTSP